METMTISPTYQIVIRKSIRDRLGLMPGRQMHVLSAPGLECRRRTAS